MNASTGCGGGSFMERGYTRIGEGCGLSRNAMLMHVSFARGPQGTYKLIMLYMTPRNLSGTPAVNEVVIEGR
jgi:hypothetical protein